MADDSIPQVPVLTPVTKPLSLIPVGLKEAALDSPTFRATVHHFGEQIDVVEKWLDSYVKAASRLSNEVSAIENIINTYLQWATPPAQVSEAILDHDYTALALKRYNEGAKEFWSSTIKWMKKVESSVIDPIKSFVQTDLATLKNYRRVLDQCQRNFDSQIARYASQSKTKEPSALREDAFQLHEAKRSYLKASMDFCTAAPQARAALDKLLVKIFSDRWRDMKNTRDALAGNLAKWSGDIDRIRGWSKEMENSERVFKRELNEARRAIEESASNAIKPSRDLDDYSKSTVAYLGQAPDARPKDGSAEKGEKQGWLFQRTVQGKPARTIWVRRWYYLKHGIFGYLSNNPKTGAVEESEKIGVLLCGVRPAFQDERRFCFEVKTKDASIELQAETQGELMEWISTFEVAKRKALENPASTEAIAAGSKSVDAAFAISPPIAPEFAAKNPEVREDDITIERSTTMGLEPPSTLLPRASTDIAGRRSMVEGGESSRERLMQKLDLHRSKGSVSPAPGQSSPMSGIASLISASHNVLPLGGAGHNLTPSLNLSTDFKAILGSHIPPSSLAPQTLANPPAPTNLSKTAVAVSGEKNLSLGSAATDGGMPGGIMANIWGTNNWGYLNRLERGEVKAPIERRRSMSQPPSPNIPQEPSDSNALTPGGLTPTTARSPSPSPATVHRKTMSMNPDLSRAPSSKLLSSTLDYPNYYPLSLKAQDAQFRTLFPEVPREQKLVLVFRATWNPSDQSEFPGRVYVTTSDIYFYSHHMGLVLISGVSFDAVREVTAAPGKDSDFVFLHLRPDVSVDGASRITLRTYLEPLKLLQRRLTYLVRNSEAAEPDSLEEVIKNLIKMEAPNDNDSPSLDSWEDVSPFTPVDGAAGPSEPRRADNRAGFRIDGTLFPDRSKAVNKNATKFRLPAQPVNYTPQGMSEALVEKEFNITAKALFHVLAGDKSAVFQVLDRENGAENLLQGPWLQTDTHPHHRREFKYAVRLPPQTGPQREVTDTQIIDVFNDHLCYVITERRTPWSLPYARRFSILSKIVVTHVAKSRCRFAVFAKIEWRKGRPPVVGRLVQAQARRDARVLAGSLTDILTEQVAMLGSDAYNNSRKAVQIFGNVGVSREILQPVLADLPTSSRERIRVHTLPSLALAATKTGLVNTLLAVLGALIYMAEATARVASAHSVLVLVLAASALGNMYLANKDTWRWYRDRQARSFLKGVGVHPPSTGLGHSIWLKDLNALTVAPSAGLSLEETLGFNSTEVSPCRRNFNALLAQTSPSSPPFTTSSHGDADAKTLSRLQRTRYNFGTYRHDLLVALRVVERVEREAVAAEWEGWVRGEIGKCRATKRIIVGGGDEDREIREWWDGYCGSCEREGGIGV